MVDVSLQSASFNLVSLFSQDLQLNGRVGRNDALAARQLMESYAALFSGAGYVASGPPLAGRAHAFQPRQGFMGNLLPAPRNYDPSHVAMALALLQSGNLFGGSVLGGRVGGSGRASGFDGVGMGIQGMGVQMQLMMMRVDIGGVQSSHVRDTPPETDPFAVHQGCRTGLDNPTRMTDQTLLVVNDILQNKATGDRGGFKAMSFEEMQQAVFEKTGEKPEITMVKTKSGDEIKALKFKDGSIVGDGAGDGRIDTGDYNFKGAIDDMKQRLGVDDAGIKQLTEGIYENHANDKKVREAITQAFPGFKDLPPEMQQLGMQLLGHRPTQPGEDVLSGLVNQLPGRAGGHAHISIFMLSMQAYQFAS